MLRGDGDAECATLTLQDAPVDLVGDDSDRDHDVDAWSVDDGSGDASAPPVCNPLLSWLLSHLLSHLLSFRCLVLHLVNGVLGHSLGGCRGCTMSTPVVCPFRWRKRTESVCRVGTATTLATLSTDCVTAAARYAQPLTVETHFESHTSTCSLESCCLPDGIAAYIGPCEHTRDTMR